MVRPFDKLLVLDLDETLVHTVNEFELTHVHGDPHFKIPGGYVVFERPGVRDFLTSCFEKFEEVALWTAGTRDYALEVLPNLCDPSEFSFIWGRDRCTWHRTFDELDASYTTGWSEGAWLKDIRKLRRRGYQKEKILFVDDTARNFKRSYGNLVHVRGFYGDPADNELEILTPYLEDLGSVPNVRVIDKRSWRARRLAGS